MRKVFASGSILAILLMVGCSTAGPSAKQPDESSAKQLDESVARSMVADRLSTTQYEIPLNQVLPYLVMFHSKDDYRTGNVGPYGPGLKQMLEQGFISQTVHTTEYPQVAGTFVRGCPEENCNLGWFKQQWNLRSVPGTNQLQGEYTFQSAIGTFLPQQASGTIEADGTFNLSCPGGTCEDTGPGQYYEDGGKGYLKVPQYSRPLNGVPYIGPATGRKLTATWYTYGLTPKVKVLMHYGPAGPYVLGGNFQIGAVTDLRLNTDTEASANFSWSVSLNDAGRLLWIGNPPNGVGHITFGKKPDQSWALDSVTNVGNLGQ